MLNLEHYEWDVQDQLTDLCEEIEHRISRYLEDGLPQNSLFLRGQLHSLQTSAFPTSPHTALLIHNRKSSEDLASIYISYGNLFAAGQTLVDCLILAKADGADEGLYDEAFLSRIVDKIGDLCARFRARIKHMEWKDADMQAAWQLESDAMASRLALTLAACVDFDLLSTRLLRVDYDLLSSRLQESRLIDAEICKEALLFAAKFNACNLARLLLHRKRVNINATFSSGRTALHEAVERQYVQVSEVLIAGGSDVDAKDRLLDTPLHKAAASGSMDLAALLLSAGADINAKSQLGKTPLHKAIEQRSYDIAELLCDRGADTEARDVRGETPLHKAVASRSMILVTLLLSNGVAVDSLGLEGQTPLHYAASNGSIGIVSTLYSKGARIDHTNSDMDTPLHVAAASNSVGVVTFLLSKGAQIEAQGFLQTTPLCQAVLKGSIELVQLLVSNGADIEARDSHGSTALMLATENREEKVAQYLLEQGARVDCTDIWGRAALHYAVDTGQYTLCVHLLHHGADMTIQDPSGVTPLDLVRHKPAIFDNLLEVALSSAADRGTDLSGLLSLQPVVEELF